MYANGCRHRRLPWANQKRNGYINGARCARTPTPSERRRYAGLSAVAQFAYDVRPKCVCNSCQSECAHSHVAVHSIKITSRNAQSCSQKDAAASADAVVRLHANASLSLFSSANELPIIRIHIHCILSFGLVPTDLRRRQHYYSHRQAATGTAHGDDKLHTRHHSLSGLCWSVAGKCVCVCVR